MDADAERAREEKLDEFRETLTKLNSKINFYTVECKII
jgi:hypothetical protein